MTVDASKLNRYAVVDLYGPDGVAATKVIRYAVLDLYGQEGIAATKVVRYAVINTLEDYVAPGAGEITVTKANAGVISGATTGANVTKANAGVISGATKGVNVTKMNLGYIVAAAAPAEDRGYVYVLMDG